MGSLGSVYHAADVLGVKEVEGIVTLEFRKRHPAGAPPPLDETPFVVNLTVEAAEKLDAALSGCLDQRAAS